MDKLKDECLRSYLAEKKINIDYFMKMAGVIEYKKAIDKFMEKFDRLYSEELCWHLTERENNWGNNYYKKHKFDKNCECNKCKYFCRCMKTVENSVRSSDGSCKQKYIFDSKEKGK